MKLSMRMILSNLANGEPVRVVGEMRDEEELTTAFLYEDGTKLSPGCVYVSDHLPEEVGKEAPALFVLTGERGLDDWRDSRHPVIAFLRPHTLIQAFNAVQGVFGIYQDWDDRLQDLLIANADIGDLLMASVDVIGNPLSVVNAHMDLLGAVVCKDDDPGGPWMLYEGNNIPVEYIGRMHLREERNRDTFLFHDEGEKRVYGINFFREEQFCGCISMSEKRVPFTRSGFALLAHLGAYVQKAMEYRTGEEEKRLGPARNIMAQLFEGDRVSRDYLNQLIQEGLLLSSLPPAWVCLAVCDAERNQPPNPDYLISLLYQLVPGSLVLAWRGRVILMLPDPDELLSVLERILPPLRKIGFVIGVSDPFDDLSKARTACKKACAAVDLGLIQNPDGDVFRFDEYRLPYMLQQAEGDFEVEDLMSAGMMRLVEHDRQKKISYIDTLSCLLKNQMNLSRTARELYLHRSSLEERLERIYSLLGTRLETAEDQLYCLMMLAMMKMNPRAGWE